MGSGSKEGLEVGVGPKVQCEGDLAQSTLESIEKNGGQREFI